MDDKESISEKLKELILEGNRILAAGVYGYTKERRYDKDVEKALKENAEKTGDFKMAYQVWYAKAYRLVRLFAPERLDEFETTYRGQKNLKNLSYIGAGITHYLQGIVTRTGLETRDYFGKFTSGMEIQINILTSIAENLSNALFNLETQLQFGLFRSEIETAKELKKHHLIRAAGAVAGVVIEGHLKSVCSRHRIEVKKKHATMSDFNDQLKTANVIDTTTWRLIQRSADIRNYCVHEKERPPTDDEVDDIIRAAEKIIAEIV